MNTFYIETLGCKVNQYESDGIAAQLEQIGWTRKETADSAAVLIINTCAVTSKAGMQSRQTIRKLIRENSNARVIVTGCHAQTDPDLIKRIDHVHQVVSHNNKTKIAREISAICENRSTLEFKNVIHGPGNAFQVFEPTVTGKMTRAYLKIQDGCDAFCTYCIVPYARGSSVSMPEEMVFKTLNDLKDKGFAEVILTGIHTGMYGLDLSPKTTLLKLLTRIDDKQLVHRIRLSSIEPGEINDGIIDLAAPGHILCDHFHIPLQSGDNDILRKMKRPYDTDFFEQSVLNIRNKLPQAGIGIDTLIGFPSETDKQFENTYNLVKRLPISYFHIFPFSPRKGTPAFHFKNHVPSDVIKERCRLMRQLDKEKRKHFIQQNLNKPTECVVQHTPDRKTGRLKGISSNYLTICFEGKPEFRGKTLDLLPEQCDSNLNIVGKPA